MNHINIISEAGSGRNFRVFLRDGTSVTVNAPDKDVALFRAKRQGFEVTGCVK